MPEACITHITPTDWLTLGAAVATIATLFYAGYQARRSRISSSAASAIAIFANIRRDFESLGDAKDDDKNLTSSLFDLLNNLELGCALYFDGIFAGRSGKLIVSFIKAILSLIENRPHLLEKVESALQEPETFEHIRKFCKEYKQDWKALPQKQPS